MKTIPQNSRPVLTQTENNTTLWVGHLKHGNNDHVAGQTFTCPSEGMLNNIQVYSSAVTRPGELQLTLHEFDDETRTWGPAIGQSAMQVETDDTSSWLRFELEPVALKKKCGLWFQTASTRSIDRSR